ncbi:MAG TPA: DUF1624 domain-containing protein [Candidatus Poseidoniales archaeon]|nr:DUF1624 domain-containing protein [Candidatus Poseidoniales archaeon]
MEERARSVAIDVLRGLALLFMIEVHAAATWPPIGIARDHPAALLSAAIGGLAAPLFVTLAGWGAHCAVQRRLDGPTADLIRWAGVRFAILFAAQILVNLIASHVFEWNTPGILSLLALCSVAVLATARLDVKMRIALLAIIVLLVGWLQPSVTNWSSLIHSEGISEWLQRLFIDGTYPFLPWFAFHLLGSIIADVGTRERRIAIVVGAASCLALIAIRTDEPLIGTFGPGVLTFFPANPPFMVAAMTGVLLLHEGVHRLSESALNSRVGVAIADSGRFTLTYYILHFIPLFLLRDWTPPTIWIGLVAVLAYTALWPMIGHFHRKWKPRFSFEEIITRLSKPRT